MAMLDYRRVLPIGRVGFSAKGNPLIIDIPHCFQRMCDIVSKKKAVAMAKEAAELLSSLESQQAFKLDQLGVFLRVGFSGKFKYHSPTNEKWKSGT